MLLSFVFSSVNHSIDTCVGLHLGTVEIQLLSPYQSSFDAQFHNTLKELLKYFQPKPFTNFAQAAVIGDTLIQVKPMNQRCARLRLTVSINWRSERIPSKKAMSCSLKNTTGSTEGRPMLE